MWCVLIIVRNHQYKLNAPGYVADIPYRNLIPRRRKKHSKRISVWDIIGIALVTGADRKRGLNENRINRCGWA